MYLGSFPGGNLGENQSQLAAEHQLDRLKP